MDKKEFALVIDYIDGDYWKTFQILEVDEEANKIKLNNGKWYKLEQVRLDNAIHKETQTRRNG